MFNDSDQRHLTCRLAGVTDVGPVSVKPDADWQRMRDGLKNSLGLRPSASQWSDATHAIVEWWVSATLRHDHAQMVSLQEAAATHLDDLCHYVASPDPLWQQKSKSKKAHLKVTQENRLYFVTHLFFVLTNWCRAAPPAAIVSKPRLRRWLAYMNEVYVLIMANEDPLAPHYALEILVELAMCLRFFWEIYGDRLMQLTSQLISTPLEGYGFVVMPNDNLRYHGPGYHRVADYHTHALVAFFLTHSIVAPKAFPQWL